MINYFTLFNIKLCIYGQDTFLENYKNEFGSI